MRFGQGRPQLVGPIGGGNRRLPALPRLAFQAFDLLQSRGQFAFQLCRIDRRNGESSGRGAGGRWLHSTISSSTDPTRKRSPGDKRRLNQRAPIERHRSAQATDDRPVPPRSTQQCSGATPARHQPQRAAAAPSQSCTSASESESPGRRVLWPRTRERSSPQSARNRLGRSGSNTGRASRCTSWDLSTGARFPVGIYLAGNLRSKRHLGEASPAISQGRQILPLQRPNRLHPLPVFADYRKAANDAGWAEVRTAVRTAIWKCPLNFKVKSRATAAIEFGPSRWTHVSCYTRQLCWYTSVRGPATMVLATAKVVAGVRTIFWLFCAELGVPRRAFRLSQWQPAQW